MRRGWRPVAGCALLAFVFLWEQVQATRLGYELGQVRGQLRRQSEVNARLRLELARAVSPEELSRLAQDKLGMSPPSPESQVFLGRSVARTESPKYLSFLIASEE